MRVESKRWRVGWSFQSKSSAGWNAGLNSHRQRQPTPRPGVARSVCRSAPKPGTQTMGTHDGDEEAEAGTAEEHQPLAEGHLRRSPACQPAPRRTVASSPGRPMQAGWRRSRRAGLGETSYRAKHRCLEQLIARGAVAVDVDRHVCRGLLSVRVDGRRLHTHEAWVREGRAAGGSRAERATSGRAQLCGRAR